MLFSLWRPYHKVIYFVLILITSGQPTLVRYSLMTWMKYGMEKSMMLCRQAVSSTTSGRSRS